MKYKLNFTIVVALLSLHSVSFAEDRLAGLKQMNSEGCVQAIAFEKNAPKEPKQIKTYCTCVYDTYYNGFSPTEQYQLFFGGTAPDKLRDSLTTRLDSAKKQCVQSVKK